MGRYEVCAEPGSIEQVIEEAGRQGINVSRIELMEPLDAFGASGSYDPSRLQQLYGGARPKVARGWRQDGDHFESLTLISPHPDAALRRLVPGTLVIRWII